MRPGLRMLVVGALALAVAAPSVWAQCPTITLSPLAQNTGGLGALFAQRITASGGTPPYVYALGQGSLPTGLQFAADGALTGTLLYPGIFVFRIDVTDSQACPGSRWYNFRVLPEHDYLVGLGHGAPNWNRLRVFVHNPLGPAWAVDVVAFGANTFGVNVAAGDVDGGGFAEILAAPGPTDVLGAQVRGFTRGGTPMAKLDFYAYASTQYGANVAPADLDGGWRDEFLTGPGPGVGFGPQVRGFSYGGTGVQAIAKVNYYAYGTLRYGVQVASADVDGDGFQEIATGPGPSGAFGTQVRGWNYDGASIAPIATLSFDAFAGMTHGAIVAGGDFDNDDLEELAVAPGPSPSSPAQMRGWNHDGIAVSPMPGFDLVAFPTSYGGRVGAGDVRSEGRDLAIASAGPDPTATTRVQAYRYDGAALTAIGTGFDVLAGSAYGANISAGPLGPYPVPLRPVL